MKKLEQILEIDYSGDAKRSYLIHNKLKDHYSNYNDYDYDSIHDYKTSDGARSVNGYLWHKHQQNPEYGDYNPEFAEENVKNLDNAVSRHKTPHKLVVYSGTRHDPRKLKNEDGIVHHPAFLSTSTKQTTAKSFAHRNSSDDINRHILKIHLPEGHSGAYVSHVGALEDEREFILPRGLNLKHIKTTSETEMENGIHMATTHTHHMKVV